MLCRQQYDSIILCVVHQQNIVRQPPRFCMRTVYISMQYALQYTMHHPLPAVLFLSRESSIHGLTRHFLPVKNRPSHGQKLRLIRTDEQTPTLRPATCVHGFNFFSQEAGGVVNIRLVSDFETGRPKGFAFVEYEDAATALSAIRNLNGYECNNRPVRSSK